MLKKILKIIENQQQNDKDALDILLRKRTLMYSCPEWDKTGIIRLFYSSEQTDNGCLFFTSSQEEVKSWKSALTDMGLSERYFQVEKYDDYRYAEQFYDLLVFDNADNLKTGTRAKLCDRISAQYVLTFGSISGEDEELFQKARKKSQLKEELFWAPIDYKWGYAPYSHIRLSCLVRYYPKSLKDFEATEEEWEDRRFIWNFINNAQEAFDKAIELLAERLYYSFGELLPELTLVCMPALSSVKNVSMYKTFSERLCEKTGMSNAYNHYTASIEADGINDGQGMVSTVFDWDYFNGRNILLFDVLYTTSKPLKEYAKIMASHGAEVIACITLGKSCHKREEEEAFSFE